MATALILPATDSLANNQQPANDKWLKKSLQADGASFCTPDNSPSQQKFSPSSPELPTPSLNQTITIDAPATTNVTPAANVVTSLQPVGFNQLISRYPISYSDTTWTIDNAFITLNRDETLTSLMSELEKEILRAQEKKKEELIQRRRQKEEEVVALAATIKETESLLAQLQGEMKRKVKHIDSRKEELEQFRLDFGETLKQQMPSSSSVQKSALTRMREEQEKKRLLAEWKHSKSEDQIQTIRKAILTQQDEVTQLHLRIVNLQKGLQGLQQLEAKGYSSNRIMRDERHKREDMVQQGIERPKAEPKPKPPPQPPVMRSHQIRMAEQQARKAEARAARLNSSTSPSSSYSVSPSSFASSSSSSSSASSASKPAKQLP